MKKKRRNTHFSPTKNIQLVKQSVVRYQYNFFLRGLKFTPTPKRSNTELKSNIQNYTRRWRLAEFSQNKEANNSEENLFQKQSIFTPPQNE